MSEFDSIRDAAQRLVNVIDDRDANRSVIGHVMSNMLDALGLEQSGQGWCPVHGDALCPEQYMLLSDGYHVAPGYSKHWSEDIRCGQRQATYRLGGTDD